MNIAKKEINKKNVGNRIFSIRKSLGYTMKEFGQKIGTPTASDSIVSRWENGKSLPNNERLKKIAELGNITVDELLYGFVETMVKNKIDELVSSNEYQEILSKFNIETINSLKERVYKTYFEYTLVEFNEKLLINIFDNSVKLLNMGIEDNTNVNAINYLISELEKHANLHSDYRAFFAKGNSPSKKDVRENMDFELYQQTQRILSQAVKQLKELRNEQLEKERNN